MDNVTHTLIGITIGTLASRGEEPIPPRGQAILAAVVASNLPDVDFLEGLLYGGGNLAYLLHHRGWTHTVLMAPPIALASLGILRWIVGKKIGDERKPDMPKEQRRALRRYGRRRLFLIALVAVFVHIFADFWNDYGVHPFAPFSGKWFYGDFIFIVEPALWVAMLPLVYFGARKAWLKFGAAGLGVFAGLVALFGPQGGFGAFLVLALWGTAVFVAEWKLRHLYPAGSIAAVAVAIVLVVFRGGSALARAAVDDNLDHQLKDEKVVQTVVSPFPGNPFLWRTIVATVGPRYQYTVRLGTVSVVPAIRSPMAEYYGIRMERMAPMVSPSVESEKTVHWIGEFRGSTLDYTRLAFQSCEFHAFLKFARIPFWREDPGRTVAGDLRYDHEKGMGFAKVMLKLGHDASVPCPEYDAPWQPPIRFELPQSP